MEDDLAGDIAAMRLATAAPVWQRMDILMASCRAVTAPVLESEPPIWRHPLRVGEARPGPIPVHGDMERQSEDDEAVMVSHAPIWRADVIRERVALAKETATQPESVSAAPVWPSWIAGAQAVSRSDLPGSFGEAEADIQTPPPIWSSYYKWK